MFKENYDGTPSSLAKLVADSPLGIGFFDEQGHWLHVNPSLVNLLGYSDDELKQSRFFDLFLESTSVKRSRSILEALLKGDKVPDQYEDVLVKKDGRQIWVTVTYSLININPANVYSVQIHDLTDQKITNEYLRYSDQLSSAGQLAAGIAHEVKNPLTAIKGFIQLMLRNGNTDNYLKIIETEVSRIETMLNEFLMLGKPHKLKLKKVTLAQLIQQVTTLLHSQAIMKDIQLNCHFGDCEEIEVVCDEARIKQVFINIIKNAIEATKKDGSITVSTQLQQSNLVATIKDQGPGIPEENLAMLGRPFFSTKETGTGLGLMMSMAIIKEHHGKIEFASDSSGATVTITLPIETV